MGIQLLSINHKNVPLAVRELFAFPKQQQLQIMEQLLEENLIKETVLLSTCNRMELYVYGKEGKERQIFDKIIQILAEETGKMSLSEYCRLYYGKQAVHHLFAVASGLDSLLIGEDQILGQVKQAHAFARENGMCGVYLNTCFRYAVTGAKKVKTDTILSKTPISTAGLAVKVIQNQFGTLKGKKIMLIGSTGKIGSIVLKNLQSMREAEIFVTMRGIEKEESMEKNHNGSGYTRIPYEQRYKWLNEMDAVISATSSPHYTITRSHLQEREEGKELVLVDLAVPMDIDSKVEELKGIFCYHMDDLKKAALENNEKKQAETKEAKRILYDFEMDFQKWLLFQQSYGMLDKIAEQIEQLSVEKGAKKAIRQFFYQIREQNEPEQLEQFLKAVSNYFEKEHKAEKED